MYDNTGVLRTGPQLLRNVETIVGGRVLERRAASPHAIWAEHWDRCGTNARIRGFQCELVARGHTPEQMCGCAAVVPGKVVVGAAKVAGRMRRAPGAVRHSR